ncbi:MAG TPA: HPP family protein [Dehalococcoidia bacterium]|nr:HPP family protein [Dehalococcoidia bacterium]
MTRIRLKNSCWAWLGSSLGMGFWFVPAPAVLGAVVLLIIARLVNNLARDRRYPAHWF